MSRHQPRIVIVDDSSETRDLCAIMLGDHGMSAVTFAEPVDAIDYLTQGVAVSAVLTDLELPQMSGIDLFRLIRKAKPGLPVVMMTGMPARLEEAISMGALPLVKPFSEQQLLAAINDAIDNVALASSQPPQRRAN